MDGQYTACAFTSYTFGFAGELLALARNKISLDLEDLPKLHLWGRSSYLLQHFGAMTKKQDRLWKSIVFTHYPELLFQTAWAIMQSTLQFAPQLAMYQLLKLLEQRRKGAPAGSTAWVLVIALGVSIMFASWTQAWEHWICWARLGQPMRAELSAMIFSKALRRKDIKGVQKAKAPADLGLPTTLVAAKDPDSQIQTDPLLGSETDLSQAAESSAEDASDEEIQKSRQSTINLVVSR